MNITSLTGEEKKKRQRNNLIRVNSRSYFISATFLEHNSPICEKYRQCKWLQAVILQYFGFCLYKTIAAQGNEIYHKSVYANKSLEMDIRVPKQKRILKRVCVLNLSDTYMLCKQTTRFAALIFYFFYDSIIYIFSFPASKYCAKLISLYKSSYFFHQNFSDSFWLWSSKHARCYNLHLFG